MIQWKQYLPIAALILIALMLLVNLITQQWSMISWLALTLAVASFAIYCWLERKTVRQWISTRSFRYGSNTVALIMIVLGILGLVNFIAGRHNFRWDTTQAKLFSLSPQSKKLVKSLNHELHVKAFFRPSYQQPIRDLLEEYANQSKRFRYEIIDPDVNPDQVKRYQIENYETLVLEYGNKIEKITKATEPDITNALIRVMQEGEKKVYFTTMHGEPELDDEEREGLHHAKTKLIAENYQVATIFLAEHQQIPDDCSVLMIVGPKKDLLPNEYQLIEQYLNRAGRLMVLLNPDQPDLRALLSSWGFEIGDNTVIDISPMGQLFGAGYAAPLVTSYPEHEITRDFNLMTLFHLVRSVTPVNQPRAGITVSSLAQTSNFPNSWGETRLTSRVKFDEGQDLKGPVSIAAAAEKEVKLQVQGSDNDTTAAVRKARVVVFGDSDFITNGFFQFQGNGDLFLNAVNWLAEQGELIAIRPKQAEDNRISLTTQQSLLIFWLGVVFLPLSILIIGVVIYVHRK
ncbi:MAG: GldG family protein [candidate division KSB1 bacterium]|nr:GldG family protein [candidate division KSB1 bacterium]MDZ7357418.1 GldG family protein [candidate division KSB1 bacterium]